MRWFVFVVLLVSLAKYAEMGEPQKNKPAQTANKQAECLPGSDWKSNCHSCRCSEDSVAECIKLPTCDAEYREPIRCKPESTFLRDCNWCTCLNTGYVLCTLQDCSPQLPAQEVLGTGKECEVGTGWKSQCNDCFCSNTGVAFCSTRPCPGHSNDTKMFCAPGSAWQYDCNTCWCTDSGKTVCTRVGCGDDDAGQKVDQQTDKNVKVNNTKQVKLESVKTPLNKSMVCQANRMFVKDCNTCWCNGDGTSYFCTRKVCVPNLADDGSEEQLENTTLSRRNRRDTPKEPPKTCLPGQEFRLDCNKCLCDNEGQDFSCTRIDCAAQNNNNNPSRRKREVAELEVQRCEPGTAFDQDCNVCRCTSDGRHATCTLKRCGSMPSEDHKETDPTTDSNFRCNPGEQFKRGCNDCTCSADGRSVFCTLRLCDKDILSKI